MKQEKIIVLGDIHGNFSWLNKFIAQENPDIILQCGDMGYYPTWSLYIEIVSPNTKIYWCDGNHEDYNAINKLLQTNPRGPIEIQPNVFYMPRGEVLKLSNNRNVLFAGGAYSIDKHLRIEGVSWFPEEILTEKEIFNYFPDPKSISK